MPSRTQLFMQLPWIGGVNTSIDEAMIPANQLTVADNVVFDTRGSRKKRPGITYNWDSGSDTSNSLLAIHDYWFGTTSKTQRRVAVHSDGKVYSYDSSGTRTQLTDIGAAWIGTLTSASMITFNNKCFIGVSGTTNAVKYWDGSGNLQDWFSAYPVSTISRSSSGTTRTIIMNAAFPGAALSTVVISGMGNASYNGTFTVATVTTTAVANDTITFTGTGALTESTTAATAGTLGQPGPAASFMREHLGRIFCNDKSNTDLLHYCETGNHTKWLGWGDSGAFPIGEGDGDPLGLTGIFPTFQGDTFVGKQTKLYRLTGNSPDFINIQLISDGIGVESHNSIAAIDQDDVMWVSSKGVHSLSASNNYGDFSSSYVSVDIQKTFNDSFDRSRLRFVQAAYLPQINSIAFAVTENSPKGLSLTTTSVNNAIWLYNINIKAWYRWSDIPCQALAVVNDTDKRRFYIGTHTGRIAKTFTDNLYDISSGGVNTAIAFRLVTGQLFVDSNPYTVKGFKRFILFYKPHGTHNINVNVRIDNFALDSSNSLSFNAIGSSAVLGTTFTLGQSVLGYDVVLGPYAQSIDGIGRGCKIEITELGINEDVEIQGFALEYELNGTGQEVVLN
jgi:hypothetical protein